MGKLRVLGVLTIPFAFNAVRSVSSHFRSATAGTLAVISVLDDV
jgi:hypothetical protein